MDPTSLGGGVHFRLSGGAYAPPESLRGKSLLVFVAIIGTQQSCEHGDGFALIIKF